VYFGFTWRDGDQAMDALQVGGPFPTQADAEAWLSEAYEELLEKGITSVSLYHEGRPVYGPMSLTE
jgi:hypothetical protein